MNPLIVAAIDCGTNSIRLYVARASDAGLVELHRDMRIVRLGQGVDATGEFAAEALERVRVALDDYVSTALELGATRVRMVATSAARDVSNRDAFLDLTAAALGRITPGARAEVIAGTEEAELSYRGATAGLSADDPALVVDLGGGSTELVVGSGGAVARAYSADIGCVRITERILRSDPPTAAEREDARRWARQILAAGLDRLPVERVRRLVPVSGTATTVAAAALRLPTYDPARIHLSEIPVDRVHAVAETLLGATRAHRAALGYMHPGRVDVIGGGALILSTTVSLVARRVRHPLESVTVSEHDILDGIAL